MTVRLPDELAAALEQESRRQGTALSEVARRAIEAHVGLLQAAEGRRTLSFAGAGRSQGGGTIARDIEKTMATEWTVDLIRSDHG